MAEMALVIPLFITIVLGIVEFGQAMMVGQLVTNAAREATRQSILDGSTNTQVQQYIEQFLNDFAKIQASDVTTTIDISSATGNPDPGGQLANTSSGDQVSIEISVPFNVISYIKASWLSAATLRGQASMRHE